MKIPRRKAKIGALYKESRRLDRQTTTPQLTPPHNWAEPHSPNDEEALGLFAPLPTCVSVDAEDIDGDGIPNVIDNCVDIKNQNQEDTDADTIGDLCDNCEDLSNTDQNDQDSDGAGDVCDNCANVSNGDQRNNDADSLGDACDNCDNANNEDQSNADGDSAGDACDNCAALRDENFLDGDGDGIGNPCDCDPQDPEIGPELETLDLGDPESLLPAQGYAFGSWTHNAALGTTLQNRAVDNGFDSVLLALNNQQQNVFIEVTASAQAAVAGSNDRIIGLSARYQDGANATGVNCGIRVDVAETTNTQRLQLLNISGTSGNPTLTKLENQPRYAVILDEQFKLSFKLKGATASCTMTFLDDNPPTTLTIGANNATNQTGSIGLFTRETKATYSNVKICQVF